jgi:membrane-bound metal-dependent hydrolase YbcI (DUF457 family)
MFLLKVFGVDTNLIVVTAFLMVAVSFAPDLDILVRRYGVKTRHRGLTHTFLFGAVVGFLFSATLGYVYGSLGWVTGFVVGFGGTASHLLGDILTREQPNVKPFYPFSEREVNLGLFKASDKTANNTAVALGVIAFAVSYVILVSL